MTQRRVIAAWFSPTDNTRTSVLEIARELAAPDAPVVHDLTVDGLFAQTVEVAADDLVVVGVPVYRGRVPATALERLAGWRGQQTPCVLVATYGNRHYDNALVELSDFLTERGFVPIAAAALVARHTYGEVERHRPSADDLAEDRAFAEAVKLLPTWPVRPVAVPGQRPLPEAPSAIPFQPRFDDDLCTLCGLCEAECTTGSITQDDHCWLDPATCIGCLRCVHVCPEDAVIMDTPAYLEFATGLTARLATPRPNEFWLAPAAP